MMGYLLGAFTYSVIILLALPDGRSPGAQTPVVAVLIGMVAAVGAITAIIAVVHNSSRITQPVPPAIVEGPDGRRLLETLGMLRRSVEAAGLTDRVPPLRHQAELVVRGCEMAGVLPEDLDRVVGAAAEQGFRVPLSATTGGG